MIEKTDHRIASHCGEGQLLLRNKCLVGHRTPQAAKTVLFVHGAAFSARTWQIVGALDAAAPDEDDVILSMREVIGEGRGARDEEGLRVKGRHGAGR